MSSLTDAGSDPPPATRRRVPRAVRERQMLDVAAALFASEGFNATTMDAIAEGSGVTKPMVYAYFESKEGIYRACMARGRRRLFAMIDQAAEADQPPDIQLWQGIAAFLEFVEVHHDSWAVLFGEGTGAGGPFAEESARLREEIARLVSQLLGEAAAAGSVEASRLLSIEPLAHALVGAGEAMATWWREHPEHERDTVARLLVNFAWMGLGDLVDGRVWRPPSRLGGS